MSVRGFVTILYNFILVARAGSAAGSNSVGFDSCGPGGAPSVLVALSIQHIAPLR